MIVTWDADMYILLNLITREHEIKSNKYQVTMILS